jgi:putative transposase
MQMNDKPLASRRRAYDSDLTDEEWMLVKQLVETAQIGPGPRRSVNLREVLNALLYKKRTGCQWRMLPHDLPPRSTVSGYYQRWSKSGLWDQIYAVLRRQAREIESRAAMATPAMPPSEPAVSRRPSPQYQVYAESLG